MYDFAIDCLKNKITPYALSLVKLYLFPKDLGLNCLKYFEYPFGWIENGEYKYDDIINQIPFKEQINTNDYINFNDNIKNIYYYHEGENDGESWKLLGQLNNNKYFYYIASCDYTGFSCQAWMKLYIQSNFDDLLYHGVDEYTRNKFLKL
jgi:hypothetical protein